MDYRAYRVSRRDREPLLDFILTGLGEAGCRIIYHSEPSHAPFRITFETPTGERMGVVAYAFLANSRVTRNRPADECRFQLKYGSKDGEMHDLWQDPYGLYTTILVGINPEEGYFVAADPVLHSPTRFFISIEFKRRHVDSVRQLGWYAWERERRAPEEAPAEVLVGGTASSLLRLIRFEREALGEDQGHRQLLADKDVPEVIPSAARGDAPVVGARLHHLCEEFELSPSEVLDLISSARRLKMAVRGWVAEEHLHRRLSGLPGVSDCERLDQEGSPDLRLRFEGSRPLTLECKNVLRQRSASGAVRLDFQRTRASKDDPCSRYYSPSDFDIVAACLHSVTERWDFCFRLTSTLPAHARCVGKIQSNLQVDDLWSAEAISVLRCAANQV